MTAVFNHQILADKLSKLNNTQQCIETLSHWCIYHRKEAELVVETWSNQFHNSGVEQKVPFLYLANDILQNSKRKGPEYVAEFWKVLPAALKDVVDNGTEHGQKAVSRLVAIWDERKVFGSHKGGLKDILLGKEAVPPLDLNKSKKRPRGIRILRRDSNYIKIKVAVGSSMEKIVSAFHSVVKEHFDEDSELNKCKTTIRRVEKKAEDVSVACRDEGDPRRITLSDELKNEEALLKQSIEKLKSIEEMRQTLVFRLREALKEQESDLESVRTQLQLAVAEVEEASNMRRRLNNEPVIVRPRAQAATKVAATNNSKSLSGDVHKKTAAAIADKLAASTSSLQMMSSVFSSFAASEAKNAGLMTSANNPNSFQGLENPVTVTSINAVPPAVTQAIPQQQRQMVLMPNQQLHVVTSQPPYQLVPSPQQYMQPSVTGMPFGYSVPPPQFQSPPPPHYSVPGPMLTPQQTVPITQQLTPPLQPVAPSYRPLQPPNMQIFSYPNHPQ